MIWRRVTTRLRPALPITLIGSLLFYVSGAALLTHMMVVHPEQWATHASGDHLHAPTDDSPAAPYDHSRSCEVGHMLHGIVASVPPTASLPPITLAAERLALEERRLATVRSHLQLRSRAPPAAA